MIEPKTPLPWWVWKGGTHDGSIMCRETEHMSRKIGRFDDPDVADYAVHAANVLPELAAALREAIEAAVEYANDRYVDAEGSGDVIRWRAALAKAEGME